MLIKCVCAFVGMNKKQYKMHGMYIKKLLLQKKISNIIIRTVH